MVLVLVKDEKGSGINALMGCVGCRVGAGRRRPPPPPRGTRLPNTPLLPRLSLPGLALGKRHRASLYPSLPL
ncbi:hypothetical protein E2C01_040984 [Portunus trituberculatus]|uniref:Uncharacterized protein n=1 Tax=Portunus trituberculatus TaxID=210409 RepID=A0A5B7FQ84_PORTR|nr:hypothetical protein [Portunus trituberculatus]